MLGICRGILLALALVLPTANASAQGTPQNIEATMPGQWSASSPQGTTQILFKLDESPTKNADGTVVFTGKMWTTGAVVVIPGDLVATLKGEALSLKYPDGSGSLTSNGKAFVGWISFRGGGTVLQNLEFRKQ